MTMPARGRSSRDIIRCHPKWCCFIQLTLYAAGSSLIRPSRYAATTSRMAVATSLFGLNPVASRRSEQTEYDRGSFDGRTLISAGTWAAIRSAISRTFRFSKPAL